MEKDNKQYESLINSFNYNLDFNFDIKNDSILFLSYIGDAVFNLITRDYLIKKYYKILKIDEINKKTVFFVKASNQSIMIDLLINNNFLNDEELDIFKRGRNLHTKKRIKSATMLDYRKSTGFETLIGFLYYQKRVDRIIDMCNFCFINLEI